MISYDDIRQLQRISFGPESLVLSLYVNVNQGNQANLNRGFLTAVENTLRQMAESNENHREKFEAEAARVLRFLGDYPAGGKGIVIFSDSSRDFWWHRDLQVEVDTTARWSPQPWVRPLLEVIEEHDHFGVVLLDKQRARILTVDASGIEQKSEVLSDVPNKHQATGTDHIWSQMQMERDHTKHVTWHVKRVAEELAAVVDREQVARLVVGGPVEATSMFINELPKRLQQMIIGTVSVPLDANTNQLMAEVRAVQERAEHDDEVRLVESMITAAHKGDRGVLGISETLSALQQGRVYCLVVARDYHAEGKECDSCRTLFADGLEKCSFCDGNLVPAPDLVNRVSHRVLEQSGKVQIVSDEAARNLAGVGIGAILRF